MECPNIQISVLENERQKNEVSAFYLIKSEDSVYNFRDPNCSEMRYSILLFDNFSRGSLSQIKMDETFKLSVDTKNQK